MRNLTIETKGDNLVVTLNKKGFDQNYLISLTKRLELEALAQKAAFTDGVQDAAEDMDQSWWDKNGESFLKGVKR